ncbi:MAG: hypothetical protein IPH78_05790 [Bacteroidetes bacterium]|nr:hypothetical protein [Bacteroidota bacterium]
MKSTCSVFCFAILLAVTACHKEKKGVVYDNGPTDSLKINEVQFIASHNSYHLKTDSGIFSWMATAAQLGILPAAYDPAGIDYWHEPLEVQFNSYNVRGLELDIYNDPDGGKYYYRMGKQFAMAQPAASNLPELLQPGFKIIHILDFDFNTLHLTFKDALQSVKQWSDAHTNHLPLFINVETKEDAVADVVPGAGLTSAVLYDDESCNKIDEEIKSVFGSELQNVLTPDEIRGSYPTLREATVAGNLPTLSQARGKIFFIMQGGAEEEYLSGHNTLQGRAMFVYTGNKNDDHAMFLIKNNSISSKTEIQQLVSQGFMVRTRTDANTDEARTGDYTYKNAAFESGAQILSTDYYRPDPRAGTPGWTDFKVQFPNNELARINPVSAAAKVNLGTILE